MSQNGFNCRDRNQIAQGPASDGGHQERWKGRKPRQATPTTRRLGYNSARSRSQQPEHVGIGSYTRSIRANVQNDSSRRTWRGDGRRHRLTE